MSTDRNTVEGVSGFWNRYANQTPFIDKAEAVKNGTVFEIQGISESVSQYGPQWVVNVVDTETGIAGKVSFTKNANRDDKMRLISDAITAGEIIEAKLEAFLNKRNQVGYDFAPVDNVNDAPF
jgi:hypothetical protein